MLDLLKVVVKRKKYVLIPFIMIILTLLVLGFVLTAPETQQFTYPAF